MSARNYLQAPRNAKSGVDVNGLRSVDVNTTAVTNDGRKLYSVARTEVKTAEGIPAMVTNETRPGPVTPNI